MNKEELISAVAERAGLKKVDVKKVLDTLLDVIPESLQTGDTLQLTGYFSLSTIYKPKTEGRNPQTGAKITIDEKMQYKFSPGKIWKEVANAKKHKKVK